MRQSPPLASNFCRLYKSLRYIYYVHISISYVITVLILLLNLQHEASITKRPVLKQFQVPDLHVSAEQEMMALVTYGFSEQGCTDKFVIFAKKQIS